MNAIIHREYGPPAVLRCEELPTPVPGAGEVLIKVRAASANPIDWHMIRGEPYFLRMAGGIRRPRTPLAGVDVAGEVVAVGANVKEFNAGDAVFGGSRGAFAEYAVAKATQIASKPGGVTFEQAACVPIAALTALQALRDKGSIAAAGRVLINGAAGGVGTFAIQIAKVLGAHVTGVCSTANVDLVRGLGADVVVDYTRDDFTRRSEQYQVILDCVGNHPLSACLRVLARDGKHVAIGFSMGKWLAGPVLVIAAHALWSRARSQKVFMMLAQMRRADLELVGRWIADGKVTPVIDRRYPLADTAAAIAHLETGHARGKVVITVAG